MFRSLIIFTISATAIWAQSFQGPAAAWYFASPGRSLRAIAGLPGAASFGPALLDQLDTAVAAPGCRQALVARQGEWTLFPAADSTRKLIAAERAAWSGDGTAALLAGNGQFQILRDGAATTPQPLPPGRVEALAVARKGTQAALLIDGLLYRINQYDELQTAFPLSANALAFAGQTLYAVQHAAGRILQLNEASAEPFGEVPQPLGLSEDGAGRRLVIAEREIVLLQADGTVEQRIAADSAITAWQAACHADHLLLEAAGELSLFRSGPSPRIFFIPPAPAAAQEGN